MVKCLNYCCMVIGAAHSHTHTNSDPHTHHILCRRSNGIVNYHSAATAAGQYLTSFTLSVTPASVGVINLVHQGVEKMGILLSCYE